MTDGRSDHEIKRSSDERVHVGGSYFNPPELLLNKGRRIDGAEFGEEFVANFAGHGAPTYLITQRYHVATASLNAGELLFAAYSRDGRLIAPLIYDEERLVDFEWQVQDGTFTALGLFAVPYDVGEIGLRNGYEVI